MANDQRKLRRVQIAQLAESPEGREKIVAHLQHIVEGPAFRGSQRSEQFLRYIVEQSIARHFDLLKERMIGVELFGRSPSYDTGEDAIVRVTASDVRRRLLQHYGKYGSEAPFHLCLPPGSYVPEVEYSDPAGEECADAPALALPEMPAVSAEGRTREKLTGFWSAKRGLWALAALNLLVLGAVAGFVLWQRSSSAGFRSKSVLPWSAFFRENRRMILVPSDPNIAETEMIEGRQVSISDYSKRYYFAHNSVPVDQLPVDEQFEHHYLRGDKTSAVDLPIAIQIARLAEYNHRDLEVRGPRSLQFSDLKTDDNFIFLGSSQSNPWSAVFADQLDFRFAYDEQGHAEYIRNVRPRDHEQARYDASTDSSYAILALVQNPDQKGQVLLLGGLTAEATESAGRLAVDMQWLEETFHDCGLRESVTPHFELLMHLNWVAGYPNHIQVVACHALTGTPAHQPAAK